MVAMMNLVPGEGVPRRLGDDPQLDSDPGETAEWLDALDSTLQHCGAERAQFLLEQLQAPARELGLERGAQPFSAYRNTLSVELQGAYPGDLELEERITSLLRWNALAMVMRANHAYGDLGGHIASYASAAEIFEVGFQHLFSWRIRHWATHRRPGVLPAPLGPRYLCPGVSRRAVE